MTTFLEIPKHTLGTYLCDDELFAYQTGCSPVNPDRYQFPTTKLNLTDQHLIPVFGSDCFLEEQNEQFRSMVVNLEEVFEILFHINRIKVEYGPWRPKEYDPYGYSFDREGQENARARLCYKAKHNILPFAFLYANK